MDDDVIDLDTADRGDELNLEDDDLNLEGDTGAQPEQPDGEQPEQPEQPDGEQPDGEQPDGGDRPRDEKGRFIPKGRFDEAVGKERRAREEAERRVAELEAKLQAKAKSEEASEELQKLESTVSEMEKRYALLLADGETEEAAKLRLEIRAVERKIARAEVQEGASAAAKAIVENERFELEVARLESQYAELNPQSEAYDPELVEMILDRHNRLVAGGTAPSKAIVGATEFIMKRFGGEKSGGPSKEGLGKAAAADRKSEQVKKNLDTMKRQPPSMNDVGLDSDKVGERRLPDISKMTEDELDALPEATRARLRGDFI